MLTRFSAGDVGKRGSETAMRHRRKISVKRPERIAPAAADRYRYVAPLGLALILLITFVVYRPALGGSVLWDDDANITRAELQSSSGLYRIWFEPGATQQYYPLLHTAFWLEHKLWGDSPQGYHVVNVLWHMLSVLLVYAVVNRLNIPGALLSATIFALHPVMVESVAWITEQKNTLSTVFYLSAVLVYVQFDKSRKTSHYLAALGLFVLALCSKTAVVTLPAALLVILWWQRGTLSWRRDVLPTVPFFIVAGFAGLVTCWVEWNHVGAVGGDFDFSLLQRFLLTGRAVWFYLSKLLWPANLVFIYPRWEPDMTQWWQWIFPIAAIAMTGALWAMRKRSRAPLAAWLFFCGTLLPMLPLLNQYLFLYTFVSDHFQYVAGLGIIIPAAAGITIGLARLPQPARWLGVALSMFLVASLALLSLRQTRLYADNVALYTQTLERNRACWMAYNNLGLEFAAKRNYRDAIVQYRSALGIRPNYADAHNNLGLALMHVGDSTEGIEELQAALRMTPGDAVALNNIGMALIHSGRIQEAIGYLERAVELKPAYAAAHGNLGIALISTGKAPQATEQFQLAVQIDPDDGMAQFNLANALSDAGEMEQAIALLQKAVRLRPDFVDAQNNLGQLLRQTGRPRDAIECFQGALRLNPDFVPAYQNLAQALAVVDQSKEAIAAALKGIEVARAAGEDLAAQQIEDWLEHYRIELRRAADTVSPSPRPAPRK